MRRGDDFGIGEWVFVKGFELALETFGGEGGCHLLLICDAFNNPVTYVGGKNQGRWEAGRGSGFGWMEG